MRTHTHSGGRRVNLILRVQNVRQKIGQNYTYLLAAGSGIWNFGIYAKKKKKNKKIPTSVSPLFAAFPQKNCFSLLLTCFSFHTFSRSHTGWLKGG